MAKARRATGEDTGGPPRLHLPVWRNLGWMLLINIIPITMMIWAFNGGKDRPAQSGGTPQSARISPA